VDYTVEFSKLKFFSLRVNRELSWLWIYLSVSCSSVFLTPTGRWFIGVTGDSLLVQGTEFKSIVIHDYLFGYIFLVYKYKVVGLERGLLSLVSTTEELLDRKVAAPV
jgi:hypothetical protein